MISMWVFAWFVSRGFWSKQVFDLSGLLGEVSVCPGYFVVVWEGSSKQGGTFLPRVWGGRQLPLPCPSLAWPGLASQLGSGTSPAWQRVGFHWRRGVSLSRKGKGLAACHQPLIGWLGSEGGHRCLSTGQTRWRQRWLWAAAALSELWPLTRIAWCLGLAIGAFTARGAAEVVLESSSQPFLPWSNVSMTAGPKPPCRLGRVSLAWAQLRRMVLGTWCPGKSRSSNLWAKALPSLLDTSWQEELKVSRWALPRPVKAHYCTCLWALEDIIFHKIL